MSAKDLLDDSFSRVGTANRIALPDIIHKSVHLDISDKRLMRLTKHCTDRQSW